MPHRVTQRGNRRLPLFFCDDDGCEYLGLLADAMARAKTRCLAWCLMDNHVHLVLVPTDEDGLRATLGEAHRRYTRMVNFREGWRGHLFQGRFASYPMNDGHLMAAVRYIENNPVAARMVEQAEDWPWSSARSHVMRRRTPLDPLTEVEALIAAAPNWRSMLRHGLEAGGIGEEGEDVADLIEARLRTGRPLAAQDWIERQEAATGRRMRPAKPGPKSTAPSPNGATSRKYASTPNS
jgi:putative transposase